MSRSAEHEQEFGSESFLDVIANVVGILIILVMVVGVQVKNAPAEIQVPEAPADLESLRAQATALEAEIAQLADEATRVETEVSRLAEMRLAASAALAEREQELVNSKQSQTDREKQAIDLNREIAAAKMLAEQLQSELAKLDQRPSVVEIESYPTPLAKAVDGKEGHFQLRAGRVTFIPLEELLEKLKADAKSQIWRLRDQREAVAMVGPIGGFRLKYSFERVDVSFDNELATGTAGSFAQLTNWTLTPVSSELGETMDEALTVGSEFRAALMKLNPRRMTVTLWTYPDSFPEYRRLKKELYHLGFATAGRPLPFGQEIGGSPHGSKSAAQ